MQSSLSRLVLVVGVMLLTGCSGPLDIRRPALRYDLPETAGNRTVGYDFQTNAGHRLVFPSGDNYHQLDDFKIESYYEGQFAFFYGPLNNLDLSAVISPVSGPTVKMKYQFIGKSQTQSGAGATSASLIASLAYESEYNESGRPCGPRMKITAYDADIALSAGYRPSSNLLLYMGGFYSTIRYSGDVDCKDFTIYTPYRGINVGIALFASPGFNVMAESSWSRFVWRDEHHYFWANGIRVEKDIRF